MAKKKREPDKGHILTDKLIAQLAHDLDIDYTVATKYMEEKAADYFRRFEIKDKIWRQAVEDGKRTEDEYIAWRKQQMLVGKRWNAMVEKLAADAVKADEKAASIIKGYMPEAYALNHNYATYMIEHGGKITTSYTLYSAETVERLWRENPKLLPDPVPGGKTARMLKANKSLRWNRAHLRTCITQAVEQGKTIPQIAQSLRQVTDMDKRAAFRNGRTMMTSAQNAGRVDANKLAESKGVELVQEWAAALDERTRTGHRMANGERIKVGDKFKKGLIRPMSYPGDPSGNPADVYNCRCTMLTWVKGFEPSEQVRSSPKMGDMTYEEWLKATPKYKSQTLPEKKARAIKNSYIREYKEMSR